MLLIHAPLSWIYDVRHIVISENFQHLAEAIGPLKKETEKLYSDYSDLKLKLDREYDKQDKVRRAYQQEVDTLNSMASKIKEYVF